MNRTTRTELARQTVEITKNGKYTSASGLHVDVSAAVRNCLDATRHYSPGELNTIRSDVLSRPAGDFATTCEVVNETTLAGIARLLAVDSRPVAALNFASAKNPGGGFLGGAQAQEESLARSSALYASLRRAPEFYAMHRDSSSLLYSDAMILSPNCPIFRNDDGDLLDEPHHVAFITSPAPNAGAIANNCPDELPEIPEVFQRRTEYVLALAAAHGYTRLVLGAWGCGVFRNDPVVVAQAFAAHLRGPWAGRFEHVSFSVLDTSASQNTINAFRAAMAQTAM